MARPRKQLPPNGLEIIRDAASNGVPETKLARALGMSWEAWKRIRTENPEARQAWEEAKAVEHDELFGMLMRAARGAPAEFDDAGNCVRAEQAPQLRAVEILWKTRHGYREQGEAAAAQAVAGVQIVMPAQMSMEQLHSMFPAAPVVPHAPPVIR